MQNRNSHKEYNDFITDLSAVIRDRKTASDGLENISEEVRSSGRVIGKTIADIHSAIVCIG
ncbi:hypothetical protein J1614_003157 [Plenodomus biglobosus]|nr:hypothetical protein J1614_003157 [Plenodomus biglobosus]